MPRAIMCPFCHEYIEDASALESGRLACPACAEEITPAEVAGQSAASVAAALAEQEKLGRQPKSRGRSSDMQQAQVVMDVVTGVNLRWKDNVIQGLAIVASIPLGSLIGWVVADRTADGVIFGGFAGLLVGLFGSGFALMVFRMFRH